MIERAKEEDLPYILRLQRLAFKEESDLLGDPDIHPMTQTLEEMKDDFSKQTFLKLVKDGTILGSVRAFEEDGTCYINRLVVHPDFWGKGIGKSLMKEIERVFGNANRYELFTRIDNISTRPFYQSLGYLLFRAEKVNESLTFVYLEKRNDH